MRKTRRKIKRRSRSKSKSRKRKRFLARHLNSPITNRWTKMTTYTLIVFEFVFVLWWLQDLLLNWEEVLAKFGNIGRYFIGG